MPGLDREQPDTTLSPDSGDTGEARRAAATSYLDVRYSADRRPFTGYPEILTRYLTRTYLGERPSGTLVELGCGRGDFLHAFANSGFRVLGLDNSTFTERPYDESIVLADIESNPFPLRTNSVDVVYHKSVIEHIHGTDLLLSETLRVLRPGGVMIALTPDWKAQFRHFYDDYTHVRPFTLMGLVDVVRSHGFTVQEARRFRQLPFLWRHPYLKPVSDLLALLPEGMKRYKTVKFSKEWMLLMVAVKPRTQDSEASQ